MGNLCVALTSSGASVKDCDSQGGVASTQAASAQIDTRAASVAKDLATVLMAAASRQRALLTQLQGSMSVLDTCSIALAKNLTRSFSFAGMASGHNVAPSEDAGVQAIA